MGRAPCCEKVGLKKGPWTPVEDMKLMNYINRHGHGNWRALPKQAGLLRCGKSCRLRWINYLRPDIKHGNFTLEEEETIIRLHDLLGNKWSAIASRLPGRTDNEIKNVWNTHIKKRLKSKENNSCVPDGSKESPSSSSESQISLSTNFADKLDGHTEQIGFEDVLRILDEPPVGLFDLLDEFREDSTSVRQDGSAIDQESSYRAMPLDDAMNDKDGNERWYRYLERELELGPEDQMQQGSLAGRHAGVESFVDERSHYSEGLSCASNDPIALYFETLPSPHHIPTFYL